MSNLTATKRASAVRNAVRFFNMAKNYHEGANELLAVSDNMPDKRHALSYPVYFLYFHTVELALKAFLLVNGVPKTGERHKLTALYEKSRRAGLVIDEDVRLMSVTMVSLLEDGNKEHGFRYFTVHSTWVPELAWTRQVVSKLMRSIESAIKAVDPQAFKPGPAAKATVTIKPSL